MEQIYVYDLVPTLRKIEIEHLSSKQSEYVEKIEEYKKNQRKIPSIRKIGELVGVSSPASVFTMLNRLAEKGYFYDDC